MNKRKNARNWYGFRAFAIVQKFTPFEATADRIVLSRAEPYEELKAWELKKSLLPLD